MTRRRRIIALALAVAVLFTIVLSLGIVTHGVGHECISRNCQICQRMESARQTLKGLTSVLLAVAAVLTVIHTIFFAARCLARPSLQGSLVALKVQLLN